MRTKTLQSIAALALCGALMSAPPGASLAASGSSAAVKNKDEVVYANLASDGSVYAVRVVNRFEIIKAGAVSDHGKYRTVTNLTDTGALAQEGGSVAFAAQEGNFYYQGDMEQTDLPWTFAVSYSINGVKTPPQELAGKAGKLGIHIATAKNGKIDPVFYDNYMLQISLTLDSDTCSDITAPGATLASAGKNTVIAHTVMPGKDANIDIGATVRDFAMDGIDIAAMPFSMSVDLPDTSGMTDDFGALADAISDLNDGVGDLKGGVGELRNGANELRDGSADINEGLFELSDNSGDLIAGSAQIDSALARIASSLSGGLTGDLNLDDLEKLPQGLTQLAQGLRGISGGLSDLKNGFSPAYAALDGAMQGIPGGSVSPEQIQALYAVASGSSLDAALDTLVASYTAGQTVKGTYHGVKAAFDAVAPAIDELSAGIGTVAGTLEGISAQMAGALSGLDMLDQLEKLSDGLSELAENYSTFHSGLKKYMGGVDEMAEGYSEFDGGISEFGGGIGKLYNGVKDLHEGTGKLSDETADMPDTMQEEIDKLLDEYTGTDFEPVSFASPLNANISLVQFVLKCDGVKKPDTAEDAQIAPKEETFWDRFVALFRGKEE
ncbi:MAG TPA: hypothetical protein VN366_02515 [Feifaniaceae bacterium]|nr:hypothetical protein [Feifaniaceae bacterium]